MDAIELARNLEIESSQMEYGYMVDDWGLLYEAAKMLRQQADRLAKYEEVLQAIANEYPELSDHKIQVQNRNHIKWAKEALDVN